jgi:hypothetical protein
MKRRVLRISFAVLIGVGLALGGLAVGTAAAGTGNPWQYTMTSSGKDGLVIQGAPGANSNAFLVRDHLGQPIFNVLQAGGASVLGDNFRVMAGDDVFNPVITLSPSAPSGACPKPDALWIGAGNIWKCIDGTWHAPRVAIW